MITTTLTCHPAKLYYALSKCYFDTDARAQLVIEGVDVSNMDGKNREGYFLDLIAPILSTKIALGRVLDQNLDTDFTIQCDDLTLLTLIKLNV